ncbi:unnamed protein product [Euphydryas editha]|uniref:Ig-like domain-containing protein n=1 Tax=Euphydryas editha TaxID=104508 RepID=A0AAU9UPK2_EUPED|nr:unnamed protein product [Euphydryas editha]
MKFCKIPYIVLEFKPKSVEIRTGDGQVLSEGAVFGPLLERAKVNITCLVVGGKPQPKVTWYFNGKEKIDGKYDISFKISASMNDG